MQLVLYDELRRWRAVRERRRALRQRVGVRGIEELSPEPPLDLAEQLSRLTSPRDHGELIHSTNDKARQLPIDLFIDEHDRDPVAVLRRTERAFAIEAGDAHLVSGLGRDLPLGKQREAGRAQLRAALSG